MPFNRLIVVLSALYIAQGLPAGLIAHALPVILREEGASLSLIGFLKLLALPWLFKFLWAPWVDGSGALDRTLYRKRWILFMQSGSALALACLAFTIGRPETFYIGASLLLILLVNTFSATQDIATDGLAVSHAPDKKLGLVNSVQVSGYKLGMIAGGSGLLILSASLPWSTLFPLTALLLVCLLVPVFLIIRPSLHPAAPAHVSKDATHSIWQVFRSFIRVPGITVWLLVLLTYKLSDGLGSTMLKPMLVDLAWQKEAMGTLVFQASVVGLLGAILGGFLHQRLGRHKALLWFALAQILSVSAFYFISTGSLSEIQIRGLVILEQFCDGLSTVALFACMMHHCRKGFEGSDYTLQASFQIVLVGMLGACSGVLAQFLGYGGLYILCALGGVFSLFFVLRYRASDLS